MTARDLERIAKRALRDLGAGDVPVTATAGVQSDHWRLEVGGGRPATLSIRAGAGTSAQFIRDQILEQLSGR